MHDAKGRQLQLGDVVLMPATVTDISPGEEYCNVTVRSIFGRRPDGENEQVSAINTGVLLRANDGDTNDWPEIREVIAARKSE